MSYWVFANKPAGTYGSRIWDMNWILHHQRFPLEPKVPGHSHVRPGDTVYLRIYGEAFIGRFTVGEWKRCPELEPSVRGVGTFEMLDLVLWPRPVPQGRVLSQLSNQDVRSRVIKITRDDARLIEAASAGSSQREVVRPAGDPKPQATRALHYFRMRLEATCSPMDVKRLRETRPDSLVLIDVRVGPKPCKAQGAIEIPQTEIVARMGELPREKLLVLYCWETWCGLAAKAAVPLLEAGFRVKEMHGGIAAWEKLGLPTEPAEVG